MNKLVDQAIKALIQSRPISRDKAQQLINGLYELTEQLAGLYELIAQLEDRYQYKSKNVEDDYYQL